MRVAKKPGVDTGQDSENGALCVAKLLDGIMVHCASLIAEREAAEKCTCLAFGALKTWDFDIIGMHDDAVVAWD
jgi:hypothetical protein